MYSVLARLLGTRGNIWLQMLASRQAVLGRGMEANVILAPGARQYLPMCIAASNAQKNRQVNCKS